MPRFSRKCIDLRKKIEKILEDYHHGGAGISGYTREHYIDRVIKLAKDYCEGVIEEIIKLSDEIEAGRETTFEEWKAFKHFRNKMRDRFLTKNRREGI